MAKLTEDDISRTTPIVYSLQCRQGRGFCVDPVLNEAYLAYWVPRLEQEYEANPVQVLTDLIFLRQKETLERLAKQKAWLILNPISESLEILLQQSVPTLNWFIRELPQLAVKSIAGETKRISWPLVQQVFRQVPNLADVYKPLISDSSPTILNWLIEQDPERRLDYTNLYISLLKHYSGGQYFAYWRMRLPYDPNILLTYALKEKHDEVVEQILEDQPTVYDPQELLEYGVNWKNPKIVRWVLERNTIDPSLLNYLVSKSKLANQENYGLTDEEQIQALLIKAGGIVGGPVSLLTIVGKDELETVKRQLEETKYSPKELTKALDGVNNRLMIELLLKAGALPSHPERLLFRAVQQEKHWRHLKYLLDHLTFTPEQLNAALSLTDDADFRFLLIQAGATNMTYIQLLKEHLQAGKLREANELLHEVEFPPEQLQTLPKEQWTDPMKLALIQAGALKYDPVELLSTQDPDLLKYLLTHHQYSEQQLDWAVLGTRYEPIVRLLQAAGATTRKPKEFLTIEDPIALAQLLKNPYREEELAAALQKTPNVQTAQLLLDRLRKTHLMKLEYWARALVNSFRRQDPELVEFYTQQEEFNLRTVLYWAIEEDEEELAQEIHAKFPPEELLPLLQWAIDRGKPKLVQFLVTTHSYTKEEFKKLNLQETRPDLKLILAQAGAPIPRPALLESLIQNLQFGPTGSQNQNYLPLALSILENEDFFSAADLNQCLNPVYINIKTIKSIVKAYLSHRDPVAVLIEATQQDYRNLLGVLLNNVPYTSADIRLALAEPSTNYVKQKLFQHLNKDEATPNERLMIELIQSPLNLEVIEQLLATGEWTGEDLDRALAGTGNPQAVLLLLRRGAIPEDPTVWLYERHFDTKEADESNYKIKEYLLRHYEYSEETLNSILLETTDPRVATLLVDSGATAYDQALSQAIAAHDLKLANVFIPLVDLDLEAALVQAIREQDVPIVRSILLYEPKNVAEVLAEMPKTTKTSRTRRAASASRSSKDKPIQIIRALTTYLAGK